MPTMQPIGALSHPAELQERQSGGKWQTRARLWANMRDLGGREVFEGEGQVQRKQVQLTIRWRGDVHAGMRFLVSGRVLEIAAVLDSSGRKRFLRCLCQEEPDRR